ncbi:MAG: hypothetical protein LBE14_06655 [Treponema sp.]|nr:hypothetical protein [Treponema sp.]
MAQVHEPRQDVSFNEVWAALMELRESQKETDRKISRLGSRIGGLIEHPGERIQILPPDTGLVGITAPTVNKSRFFVRRLHGFEVRGREWGGEES